MSYNLENRDLIEDPFVVMEFDRLSAFLQVALAGFTQRDVERGLELGEDAFSGALRPGSSQTQPWTVGEIGNDGVALANQAVLEFTAGTVIANFGINVRDPLYQPE